MLNIGFKEFLTEADLDGDGNVNYEEFITLIFKVFYSGQLDLDTDV